MTKIENPEIVPLLNVFSLKTQIPSSILEELQKESQIILENSSNYEKLNGGLAGNIAKEYSIHRTKGEEILKPHILSLAKDFTEFTHGPNQDYNYILSDTWINFQKRYEFNPLHDHDGDLSFVLWIKIPYDLEEELSHPNCKNSNIKANSMFHFVLPSVTPRGRTCFQSSSISVDKSYEGTMIMFPSFVPHVVYPFYTSNEYRISISGNISIKPKNHQINVNKFSY